MSEKVRPRTELEMELFEEATARYEKSVGEAFRYLMDRGIAPGAQKEFRLGVVADPLPQHEAMRGMLSIPYLDKDGKPITMRFRRLGGDGPKYRSISGDPARVFNVGAIIRSEEEISVCEGEMDAITVSTHVGPAIGFPGATQWRYKHKRMLTGFNRVYVWADADAAGGEFATAIQTSLPRTARIVPMPKGMDVNDLYLEGGVDALLEAKERAR